MMSSQHNTHPLNDRSVPDKNIGPLGGLDAKSQISCHSDKTVGEMTDLERRKTEAGEAKFSRLGWKRLVVVLIIQAVALGSLSLPSAFATLGMVCGVICTVGLGLLAIYPAYIIGQVKIVYPQVKHYADAGGLMFGAFGSELFGVMLVIMLILLSASHCLTGTIAFATITDSSICSLVFGGVSAIILLLLSIPPSFAEIAILGYIDFVSIIAAIGITIVATGVQSKSQEANWSAWPKPGITFDETFIAICNIFFAYSFTISQFSFMNEMHTPTHYMKSITTLVGLEIVIYTLTGSMIYSFVGQSVQSPALLSAGPTVSKVVFGVALPVIFISGSINTVVAARYIHGRLYANSVTQYINTVKGWTTWLVLISAITVVAFIIAESLPFFGNLIAITSSLLNSGFSLHFPALMWFILLKKGKWTSRKNILLCTVNLIIFGLGIVILVCGTYAAVQDMVNQYNENGIKSPFSCTSS